MDLTEKLYELDRDDYAVTEALHCFLESVEVSAMDSWDRERVAVAFGMAWVLAKDEDPCASNLRLREVASRAACEVFNASITIGGLKALRSGAEPGDGHSEPISMAPARGT